MTFYSLFYSIKMAVKGLWLCICYEKNMRIHLVFATVALILGCILMLLAIEWCIILFCIGMVLCMELMNTSIEYLANLYNLTYDLRIKHIKDISAAAVLCASVISFVIGCIIFLPKCLNFIKNWKVMLY